MLIIRETIKEINELLTQAEERSDLASIYKNEYSEIASTFYDIAVKNIDQAEKLHDVIVRFIDDLKVDAKIEIPESMKSLWNYEHKVYLDLYKKAKMAASIYSKI